VYGIDCADGWGTWLEGGRKEGNTRGTEELLCFSFDEGRSFSAYNIDDPLTRPECVEGHSVIFTSADSCPHQPYLLNNS